MKIDTTKNFRTKTDYSIFICAVLYYLLTMNVPFFAQITNPYLTLAVIMFILFAIAIKNPVRYIGLLIPFLGVVLLDLFYSLLFDISSVPMKIYSYISWLLPALLSYFILYNKNVKIAKIVLIIIFSTLLITAITSYFALHSDPEAARIAATIVDSKDPYAISLNMRNIGGFSIVYIIVASFPMIVALRKYRVINLPIFLILTILFLVYVIATQYTTATIILSISLLTIVIKKKINYKTIIILFIIAAISIFIGRFYISDIFYLLSKNMASNVFRIRFSQVAGFLSGANIEKIDGKTRFDLMSKAMNSFFNHPILGNWLYAGGDSSSSGHSFILDILAKYGFLGISALIFFYRQIYKKFYLPFKKERFFGYMIICLIISILLGVLNPINDLFALALIIPLSGYIINNNAGKLKVKKGGN